MATLALFGACSRGDPATGLGATTVTPSCADVTPLALNVGDVHMLTGAERSSLCIAGGAGSEYVLIPLNARLDTTNTPVSFTLKATGTAAVTHAPTPQRLPAGPAQSFTLVARVPPVPRDRAFDLRLRQVERRELTPKIAAARSVRSGPSRSFVPSSLRSASFGVPSNPTVGSLISLNGNAESACASPQPRGARVVAVSQYAIVAVDTLAPANGFTNADYLNFAATFDTLVYPLDTLNFGAPTDIDHNGRVLLFFSPVVNQLTAAGATSYISGFFYARDLFPPSGSSSLGTCAGSNYGELFYLPVVDSARVYNGFFQSRSTLSTQIFTTFVHELQHLINGGRHLYINTTAANFEEIWLDEDQSLIGQELLYYHVSGFGPRQKLTRAAVTTGSNANGTQQSIVNAYGIEQLSDLLEYLTGPETNSPYEDNDQVPTAGAGWEWLRYVLDNTTGPQSTFTRALDNGVVVGFANLQNVFSGAFPSIATSYQQWAIAQYVDGTLVNSNPLYSFPSWNYRDVIGNGLNFGTFPLKTHPLVPATPVTLSLRPGSVAYLRFRVNSGLVGQVVPANNIAVSSAVTFALIRTF